jgi:polar amino acid transport system substrate-binding protein
MWIKYKTAASPKDGFHALRQGKVDALVYDRPILAWMIRQGSASGIALTDMTFEPQSDAIVLQNDSAIRRQINVAPLDAEQSDWWKDTLFRYLGHAGG